jgi:hypothetical protein
MDGSLAAFEGSRPSQPPFDPSSFGQSQKDNAKPATPLGPTAAELSKVSNSMSSLESADTITHWVIRRWLDVCVFALLTFPL